MATPRSNDNTVHVGFDDVEFATLEKRQRELETTQGVRIPLSLIVRGIVRRELGVPARPSRPGPKRAKPRSRA